MTPQPPPPREKDPASASRPDRTLLAWQVAAAVALAAYAFAHFGVPAGFATISFVAAGMGFTYAGSRARRIAAAAVMAAAGAALARMILGAA